MSRGAHGEKNTDRTSRGVTASLHCMNFTITVSYTEKYLPEKKLGNYFHSEMNSTFHILQKKSL